GNDRGDAAQGRALAPRLPAVARSGHEAEPREADDRPQDRRHRSLHVEEQGEVRLDEASQAKVKTRLTCGVINPQERCDHWRSTWRRAWFEGEYPLSSWARSAPPEFPIPGYAPSEFQTKQWPEEVPTEGWFPLSAREQQCFDLVEDANESSSSTEGRQSSALASGFAANRGRVADREGYKGRGACPPNAGKPPRSCRPNAGKPRRTCRLEADASVEEGRRRSGEICLDTTFHRRMSEASSMTTAAHDVRTIEVQLPADAFRFHPWQPREIAQEMRTLWLL